MIPSAPALTFSDLSPKSAAAWEAFLKARPYHNAFQSARMHAALTGNPHYRPVARIALSVDDTIRGGYIIYVIEEVRGPAAALATRALLMGGPAAADDDPEVFAALLDDLRQQELGRAMYLDIWHGTDQTGREEAWQTRGFGFTPHHSIALDLNRPAAEVWAGVAPRKRRYIRSNKEKVSVRVAGSGDGIDRVYEQLQHTYRRARVPLIDRSVFHDVHQAGAGIFLLAEHDGRPCAARVCLPFGNRLTDWYAGSSNEGAALHANETLVGWLIDHGLNNGFHWLDFGGAGQPGRPSGIRTFKSQFGGAMKAFGRHRRVLAPWRHRMFRTAMSLREKLVGEGGRS